MDRDELLACARAQIEAQHKMVRRRWTILAISAALVIVGFVVVFIGMPHNHALIGTGFGMALAGGVLNEWYFRRS